MPKKYDRCVKKVRKRIATGKIPKTYKANGRKKTNPYAICRASINPLKKGTKVKAKYTTATGEVVSTKPFIVKYKTMTGKTLTRFSNQKFWKKK